MSEIEHDGSIKIKAFNKDLIRIEDLYNPLVQRLRIDLSGTLGKNSLIDELVKPAHEFFKSVTKTKSNVREPKAYNKAINNSVYENRWREVMNE